jgi:hypothetical protein
MSDETDNERNEGRIALWPGKNPNDEAQPYLTGKFTLEGKKYFVSLWKRDRNTDRQPIFSGNVTLAIDDSLEIT